MMAVTSPSAGVMFAGAAGTSGVFPKNLRKSFLSRIEPRFAGLFGGLLLLFSVTVIILSNAKINEEAYSEKAMLQIQERYAQLVLNQPKPAVEEAPKKEIAVDKNVAKQATEKEKTEEVKVDRAKETFVEKKQRQESGAEQRRIVREQASRQIQAAGIFAAITAASGGSDGGASTSDLLGTAGLGVTDLGGLSLTKGTFAAKNVDPADLIAKKGSRTTGVNIAREEVGRTSVSRVASNVQVNITSTPPEISGESANLQDRSQSAIQSIVSRESQRLKRLYEEWLKRDPSLSGRLTIKFVILPSGSVASVSVVKSTTNNTDFDEMVLRYIKRWQFPSVEGAGPVEVVYPFVFEGQS